MPEAAQTPNAAATASDFRRDGVDAVVIGGEVTTEKNGATRSRRVEAVTLPSGRVLIRNDTDMDAREIAAHERVHVYRRTAPEVYRGVETAMKTSGLNIQAGHEALGTILDAYEAQHPGIDSINNMDRLYEEIASYIAGMNAVDPDEARRLFAPLVNDYDAVVEAIENAGREFAGRRAAGGASAEGEAPIGKNGRNARRHWAENEWVNLDLTRQDDPRVQAYGRFFRKWYDAGRVNLPAVRVPQNGDDAQFPAFLQTAIYQAGQNDAKAEKRSGAPVVRAGRGADNKTEAMSDGGQDARAESGGGNGKRTDGVAAAESGGSVEARTGSSQARRSGSSQTQRAAKIRAAVQAQRIVSESTAGQGISTGTASKTLKIVPSSLWTDEMRSVSRAQSAEGRHVIYFTGELEFNGGSGAFTARGAISADGKRIWIKADHPDLTVEQIAKHEEYHAAAKKDPELNHRLKEKISGKHGSEGLDYLSDAYAENYFTDENGKLTADADYILEEILADAYAGIDVLDGIDFTTARTTEYTEEVREEVQEAGVGTHGPPASSPGEAEEARQSIDPSFASQLDAWDGKSDKTFRVGTTSKSLQSIGVQDRGVIWHSRKIAEILRKHDGMTRDILKQVPGILENPVIVLKSIQSESRIAVFGEIKDKNGAPVTAILELQPTTRGGELLNMNVIASAYGKDSNPAAFVRNSELLYLDPDKNRTESWMQGLGLQLPSDATSFGSVGTISYPDGKVKIDGVPYGQYMQNAEGKYSRDAESIRDLREQNETLRARVDYWKGQTRRTERLSLRQSDIDRLARGLIEGYDSRLAVSDISADLKALGEYIVNGEENGNELSFEDVKRRAGEIARDIVQNASTLASSDEAQTYRNIRAYLRGTRLSYTDRGDIPDFNDLRKRNFGRFTIAKDGIGVDTAYQQLTSTFGEEYFPSDITHPAEQLMHFADLLDGMRPIYENPHSYYMAEAIEYCANEIIDGLIDKDVRQTPPTFADRQAAKLDAQKAEDRQRLDALRRQKNERISEIEQKGRERVARAMEKERERRAKQLTDLRERYRTKETKARERKNERALRAKIIRHAKELSAKLLKPTDRKHIPESLRAPVASLLDAINLESQYTVDPETGERRNDGTGNPTKRTEAFRSLKEAYTKALQTEESLVVDPDLLGDRETVGDLDEVISMRDILLADMNTDQLGTIWQTLRAIEASIASVNKVLGASRYATISDMADALREDTRDFRTKQNRAGLAGGLETFLSVEMLRPVDYMHRLGRSGDALWHELRGAQDSYVKRVAQAQADMKTVIGNTDIRAWGGKKAKITTFTTESGDSIDLTPAQVMELYLLMKRPQALQHILKGGIRQAAVEREGGKLTEGSAPVRVTLNDLAKIISTLTAEQTRIADELGKYASGVLPGWGNEASMAVYGYRKFTENHYWHIRSDPSYIKSESGKGVDVTVRNRGCTKQTVQQASNAIMISDVFDTFAQHVNDMATYSSWLAAIEDAERLKNFRYRNDEGATVGSVKETINRVMGNAGTKYLDLLIEDINQGVKTRNDSFDLSRFTANYKAAAVGANLRVIVQQPTSILRAAAIIDPKYLAAGALRKSNWELVKKWAPIAQWKDWGYFELDNGRLIKDIILSTDTALDRARQAAMTPAGKADSITWGRIWTACEAEILATHKELVDGTDEFHKAVADRFNEVIDRSQVVDGILQRNQTMRSSSDLVRMATSFMSEPVTSFSMLSSALYDITHAQGDGARGKARKRLARTLAAVLMADVLCAAVASLIDAVRDDDKEKAYWQKWAEAFTGITGDEDTCADYINSILSGNLGSQINLLAKIPFIEDIFSLLQGYSITRMDMDSVQKLFKSIQRTSKALSGEGTATVGAALADLIANAARLWGLPVYNIKRDLTGTVNTTLSAIGNWKLMYEADKLLYSIDSSDNKGHYYDIAFYAWQKEDRTQYNAICADLIAHGYNQKDIDNAIRTRLKKTKGFSAAADTIRQSVTEDLEQSRGFKSLPADYREKALEATDEYATAVSMLEQNADYTLPDVYSWVEKAEAGADVGVEPWEYILFRTAMQMAADDGSLQQEEVVDALEGMTWLTDAERDYLFGTRYESDKNNPWA